MRLVLTLALVATLGCKSEPDPPVSTPVPDPVDADGDGHAEDVDCDDADPAIHPGADELCDAIDNDCDDEVDEDVVFGDWFEDADLDGYGDAAGIGESSCLPVAGRVADDSDCDDDDDQVHPDAVELCNGADDDCSGTADDGLVFLDYFPDLDGDGFGDGAATPVNACDAVAGHVADATDCDDGDDTLSPVVTEICDGVDNNCDGTADEGVLLAFSVDLDADGYGVEVLACTDPDGAGTELPGDCDDAEATVYPGAPELCDGFDSDCAGGIPEHAVPSQYPTVQAAVDAAASGDTVCIAAGTYTGGIVVASDLRLEGTGSGEVFLDGGGTERVLDFATGAVAIELEGLTLRHGLASEGAGLRIQDATASSSLIDVHLAENQCTTGPCSGAGGKLTGTVDLVDVVVRDNAIAVADGSNVLGAGLYLSEATVSGQRVEFLDNHSTTVGAIWIEGAAFYAQNVELVLTDSLISGNNLTGGQTRGHAFGANGGSVTLERVVVEDNWAFGDTYPYPAKGAIHVGSPMIIRNSVIARNDADAASGDILGTSLTTFGLHQIVLEHTTVTGNTGTSSWSSLVDANNCDLSFSHVIAWDNQGSSALYGPGTVAVDYSLVGSSGYLGADFTGGTGNLTEVDPLFVDAVGGDYHLDSSSPAIDAGDPLVLDGDGSTADLGAYGGPAAP